MNKDFEENLKKLIKRSNELARKSEELMGQTQELLRQFRESRENGQPAKLGKT